MKGETARGIEKYREEGRRDGGMNGVGDNKGYGLGRKERENMNVGEINRVLERRIYR